MRPAAAPEPWRKTLRDEAKGTPKRKPSGPRLNDEVLEQLVRHAMAAGAACFVEKVRAGDVAPGAPLMDAFGDFPSEFIRIRAALLEGLVES